MDLSIIIPSFNTKALLERCLDSIFISLQKSDLSFEIIVVDNASKDGTRELLNNKYPQVKTILNNVNLGYSISNNQAIIIAKGKYILLLNSDTVILKDAIEQLFVSCKLHKKTFVGGKLLNENLSPQPSCGPFYSIPVIALMIFAKGDYWGVTRYSPSRSRQVDWVSGACLLGSKASFIEVGLFDEKIFMYMEDIEFLYRARVKGYVTFFIPSARFIHTGAASSGDRKTPVTNIYRGLSYFYTKHSTLSTSKILVTMLKAKALLAIHLGRIMRRQGLVQTYEEALSVL